MPQRPKKKSSFDKTVSQYERKLERQRQMEKFEQVAAEDVDVDGAGSVSSFFPSSDTGRKKKPDPTGASGNAPPKGAIENARKFLWDEDEEDYELPSSKQQKNPNQYGGMNDSASSRASMFFAKTGIEQDTTRLKDIRGFESPGLADNMHDVNLNTSFRHRRGSLHKNQGYFAPIGACCSGCFAPCSCTRKQHIALAAAFVFLALGVAGVVIGVTVGFSFGSNGEGSSQTSNPGGPIVEKEEFPLGHDRYNDIREYIVNTGHTDETAFDDEETPQSKALWWVAVDDQAQVEIGDCQLLERYALATFFFATSVGEVDENGGMALVPEWDNSKNWLSEVETCKWHGIQCVETEAVSKTGGEPVNDVHVVHVYLPDNNIKGYIPSEIAGLELLKMLNLRNNQIQGEIPESLGTLQHLAALELQGNQLVGNIPAAIGECRSLRNFHVNDNELSGPIPPELGELAQLRKFDAGNNQLEGPIPHTINGWKSMIDFRVNNNKISGNIPFQVSHMPNLEILFIQDNEMTGEVPHAISKLSKLREFRFSGNSFSGSASKAVCGLDAEVLAADCGEDGAVECYCCQECYP